MTKKAMIIEENYSHDYVYGEIVTFIADVGHAKRFVNSEGHEQYLCNFEFKWLDEDAHEDGKRRLPAGADLPTSILEVMAREYEALGYDGEVADIEAELERRHMERIDA